MLGIMVVKQPCAWLPVMYIRKQLIKAGADLNARDNDGQTALEVAGQGITSAVSEKGQKTKEIQGILQRAGAVAARDQKEVVAARWKLKSSC